MNINWIKTQSKLIQSSFLTFFFSFFLSFSLKMRFNPSFQLVLFLKHVGGSKNFLDKTMRDISAEEWGKPKMVSHYWWSIIKSFKNSLIYKSRLQFYAMFCYKIIASLVLLHIWMHITERVFHYFCELHILKFIIY